MCVGDYFVSSMIETEGGGGVCRHHGDSDSMHDARCRVRGGFMYVGSCYHIWGLGGRTEMRQISYFNMAPTYSLTPLQIS